MKRPNILERLRAKRQSKAETLYGVVWYDKEEEWAKVKAFAADPEPFEATYKEWLQMMGERLRMASHRGMQFQKVIVQALELSAWCRLYDKPNDSNARAEYVSEIMQARPKTGAD